MADEIQFFSEIDMNEQTGAIRSQYPCWYFPAQISDLEESARRKDFGLKNNLFAPDQVAREREELKQINAKLKQIESSQPKLEGTSKDRCYKAYQKLAEQIRDSMPTRKQTKDGLVSPHQELKRLNEKNITIDPVIAKACGVSPHQSKVTGKEAAKCFKILGGALGEPTNTEVLRRDGNSEAYQSMNDLTKAILEGVRIKGA